MFSFKGSKGGMKVGGIFPSKNPCIRDPCSYLHPTLIRKMQAKYAPSRFPSQEAMFRDPKKHISISSLWAYPYLIGLHYKGGLYGISLSLFLPYLYSCEAPKPEALNSTARGLVGFRPVARNPKPQTLARPQRTYLFKDLYKEVIIGKPRSLNRKVL